jgi:hypothetical protein
MEETASENGEVRPVSQKTVILPTSMTILQQELIRVVEKHNLKISQSNINLSVVLMLRSMENLERTED